MFDRVIADKVTITGYHYGVPGAGTHLQGRQQLRVQPGQGLSDIGGGMNGHAASSTDEGRRTRVRRPFVAGWW